MKQGIPEYKFLIMFRNGDPITRDAFLHKGFTDQDIEHNLDEGYIVKDPYFKEERYYLTETGDNRRNGGI